MSGESHSGDAVWQPRFSPFLIAMSVMLATFMEVLDTSVANVALPHIAGSLAASSDQATWVLTSYLVANAVVLPMTGWLGAKFGRKRFLLVCITLFTLASALCGAADSLVVLILSRVLQGAAGGALQPVSQAIIIESFPAAKRGQGMAIFAMGVVVAPIIGPTFGGWITDSYSWRWVFYVNVPVGMLAVWLISMFIEDPPYLRKLRVGKLDTIGFGFLTLWLATLQFVLDRGQEFDWFGSPSITVSIVVSVLSLVAFVARQLTAPEPLVNLRVLANRNFIVATAFVALLGALLYGTTALLPLFMQGLLGYTATDAGIALSPRGAGAMFAALVVGRILGVVSPRMVVFFGFALMTLSLYLLGFIDLQIGMASLIFPIVIAGLSITSIFIPLSVISTAEMAPENTGTATGVYNLVRNLGGSIGISAMQTFVTRESQKTQDVLAAHTTTLNPIFQHHVAEIQASLAPHVGLANAAHQAYQAVYDTLLQQAASLAYIDVFQLLALICLICTPCVFLMRNVTVKPGGAAATH